MDWTTEGTEPDKDWIRNTELELESRIGAGMKSRTPTGTGTRVLNRKSNLEHG